jgi:hypothetical protein
MMLPDARDVALVRTRVAHLDAQPGPRVGDVVRFADGIEERIAHLWRDGVETSGSGSFYLSDFGCAYSGSSRRFVPLRALAATDGRRAGTVWLFHHDIPWAGNTVTATIEVRLFECASSVAGTR